MQEINVGTVNETILNLEFGFSISVTFSTISRLVTLGKLGPLAKKTRQNTNKRHLPMKTSLEITVVLVYSIGGIQRFVNGDFCVIFLISFG